MGASRPSVGIGRYFPDTEAAQSPTLTSVVIPTVMRPSLLDAVASVFDQVDAGRIAIMIGVDQPRDPTALYNLLDQRPPNISALVLSLPYSTSVRHGGPHLATDGGSLRTTLSFMANSRYVAYLDDDNSWMPRHLKLLQAAMVGKAWAFSHRLLIDEETGEVLGPDRWDSLGPDRGRFASTGGHVDPNCLIVDKVLLARTLGRWSETADGKANEMADRHFFEGIRRTPFGEVTEATVRYGIRRSNILHKLMAREAREAREAGA